jgi:polyribonucleotide nucleotidyltransferase
MDFKVAGTAEFVTALQLDTKIDGLPADVLSKALHQARDARLIILDVMAGAISAPRDEVKPHAPKIVTFEIPIDKIGEVIGPKGKVINAIQQETGADVNVDDDGQVGTVTIGAKERSVVDEARRRIETILDPPSADVGAVYTGKVVNITKFGAFVNILPGRDGLIHISRLGQGKRVERVEDVVELGQEIEVRVDDIDPQGKVSLSLASSPPPSAPSSSEDTDGDRPRGGGRERERGRSDRPERNGSGSEGGVPRASFEDAFDAQLSEELGDLGPRETAGSAGGGARREGGGRDSGRRPEGRREGAGEGPRRRPRSGRD